MATYEIELSDGRVFHIEVDGNTPPSEEELMAYIENNPQSIGQLEQQADTVEPIQQNKPVQELKPVDMSKIDTSWKSVVKEGLKGFGQGIEYGINKLASGATLGATDWARKKLREDVEGQYKAVEDIASPISAIGTGVEIAGSFPTGGGILNASAKGAAKVAAQAAKARKMAKAVSATKGQKLASKGLNFAEKAARYGYIPATGMAEGAASGYFATDSGESALASGIVGGVVSGALGAAGGLAKQGLSAARRVRNIDTGLENAILSPKGRGLLTAGVDSNTSVAQTVKDQIPNVLEGINKKADDAVRSIFGSFDVPQNTAQARIAFKNYLKENASKQGIQLVKNKNGKIPNNFAKAFGLNDLSITQRKKLNQAGAEAYSNLAKSTKDKEIIGQLGFLQETEAILTDMADAAKKVEGALSPVKKATRESLQIEAVKEKLLDKIAEQGDETLQLARRNYKTAMRIQNAFDEGKKYTAESIKDYALKTPLEKDAFLMGTLYKAEVNPTKNVAQRILDNLSVLRDVDPKKSRQVEPLLRKLSLSYNEGIKLGNRAIANTERRLKDFNIPTVSVLLNKTKDIATARKFRKASKHILDPQKHPLAEPNLMPYYNFGQQATNALIRELANEEVR